ncbi:hypothetical protein ACD661_10190 [Legionella lytica]|uniref:Uncharacterized protein n=1 Tax=Legionella lytica TaxID=96232 RepID=A0ABW8D894_9GAMM
MANTGEPKSGVAGKENIAIPDVDLYSILRLDILVTNVLIFHIDNYCSIIIGRQIPILVEFFSFAARWLDN